ncbi:MAG: hypothetical protein MUF83_09095 [Acidimicrobiales bacterium]|jgi:hypothetical protein|nr:hypothetical protein [Acidimicrobiales bacterium]
MTAVMERVVGGAAPVSQGPLSAGDPVQVQNRFDGSWCSGFEVAEILSGVGRRRYRVRRLSDGAILPVLFVEDALR